MKREQTKKLCMAGILCAVAVVGSTLSVPVFGSKCAPVQHMVNVLCAVLLGPGYGVGVAFCASLIRNLLALGSILAFPGSMFGALLCGVVYWKSKNLLLTLLGEVLGTAILGGLLHIRWQFLSWVCQQAKLHFMHMYFRFLYLQQGEQYWRAF